ncbi:MAG: c-type cytochrome domain-containing protein, partial [Roseimicrobium sp.]
MSPSDTSEQPATAPSANRSSLLGWASAVGIIVLFALGLYMYPPLANAGREVPTPTWALFFGRFHPIAVHVPVGVLFLAAIMDVLAIRRGLLGEALKPAITFIMGVGAFGAVIAVILGVVLSREGGYDSATFQAHQTLGLTTAVLAILSFVFKLITDSSGRIPFMHRFFMVSTLGAMSVGAHLGGNMVHGPDYLLDHAPTAVRTSAEKAEEKLLSLFGPLRRDIQPTPDPDIHNPQPAAVTVDPADPTVYAAVVAPLVETYCYGCHGADKSKADLRLHTHELMIKGGDSGYNLVPGQPDKSLMITTMLIPVDDDPDGMHMPPDNKAQPSKEEIAILSWWVKEGASKDLKMSEAKAKLPTELHDAVQTLVSKAKTGSGGSTPPVFLVMAEAAAQIDPAVAEAMKKINGSGASLAPIAADAKQLRFTALNVAKDYADANLKELEPIAANIVALDLARTKVTDAACDTIAKMANLKELHLENTAITDAGVEKLKGLANLEYLNLYSTKVTDKVFTSVDPLAKLKSLYVWQTGVTRPAAEAFKAKHPGMLVNTGWTEADNAKAVAVVAPAAPAAPATAAPAAPAKPAAPTPAPAPATPAPAPAKPAAAAAVGKVEGTALPKAGNPDAKVFADVVLPILEAKCVACHGTEKSKGKLKLHTFADALKGGSDGATTIIGGNVKDSLLLVRAKLPVDDDDHMPPSDEP